MQSLHQISTPHHTITVYETSELYGERGRFRVLQFSNEAVQGAMDLDEPDRIVFEYPRALIHLMEMNRPSFEDVFLIGHGIGTLARHYADKRVQVAELDEAVVEVSRSWFGYAQDNVSVGDGRVLLQGERDHSFDYIVVDAFTHLGTPRQLVSREFFELTRRKLDPRGAVLLNLMAKHEQDPHIRAVHTTLREVYPYTKSFLLPSEGMTELQNIILMGGNTPLVYQGRHMAGFREIELAAGYVLRDDWTQQ